MKFYRVPDESGDCGNGFWFASKREALAEARHQATFKWPEDGPVKVELIDIGKVDQARVLNILEGHGYVEHRTTVATFNGTRSEE